MKVLENQGLVSLGKRVAEEASKHKKYAIAYSQKSNSLHKKELTFLERLIKSLEKKKVHYTQMTSWSRSYYEGYNDGLKDIIKIVESKLKRLRKNNDKDKKNLR